MKNSRFADFLWSYLFIMVQLIYLFLEPLIFSTVGLILQVSWKYYLLIIGGYYALTAIWELALHLFAADSKKKFHSPFIRKLQRVLARLSDAEKKADDSAAEEH